MKIELCATVLRNCNFVSNFYSGGDRSTIGRHRPRPYSNDLGLIHRLLGTFREHNASCSFFLRLIFLNQDSVSEGHEANCRSSSHVPAIGSYLTTSRDTLMTASRLVKK